MTTLMIPCFIGTGELLLIGGLALLLFGGKKLPEMMRGLGQGVKQFKEGMKDVESTINEDGETTTIEKATTPEKAPALGNEKAATAAANEKPKDEKAAQ